MTETKKKEWEEHKKEMDLMRRNRREQFKKIVKIFQLMGFDVRKISEYQYRFNDSIDIYPSNKRYHDLKTNKRGDIREKSFNQLLREYFNLKT